MKNLRRILSRYTGWLLKKGIIDHPTAMIDYEIADQYLESEASRSVRETVVLPPDLLDEIIGYIEMVEQDIDADRGSVRGLKELIGDGDMPDIYDKLLNFQSNHN